MKYITYLFGILAVMLFITAPLSARVSVTEMVMVESVDVLQTDSLRLEIDAVSFATNDYAYANLCHAQEKQRCMGYRLMDDAKPDNLAVKRTNSVAWNIEAVPWYRME